MFDPISMSRTEDQGKELGPAELAEGKHGIQFPSQGSDLELEQLEQGGNGQNKRKK